LESEGSIYTKPTFLIAVIVVLVFLLFGIIAPDAFGEITGIVFDTMIEYLGWSFILGASIFLIVILFLLLSPFGHVKLGLDEDEPAYSTPVWLAMLFSCGMGIGLLFWGVSEPIWHYIWPPFGEAGTEAAMHVAMRYSFFHWGFHPWAIYSVVAGSLAYFSYRKGLPMLLSSCLEPILGRKGIEGPWGILVNVIGVFATLFGLGTSLGLGAMQLAAGLDSLFGIPSTPMLYVFIVAVITIAAVISTYTGIDRGIKYLSQLNIIVAVLLVLLVFILGPTLFILNLFTHSVGEYVQNIISMSFNIDAAGAGTEGWIGAWTVFYWAWWIAWAPFVGTFIARISKGRTIRNFVIGVMLVPVFVSMVWFAVFGGAALYAEHFGPGGIADAVNQDSALGFFSLLAQFPAASLLILVAMFSVTVFFITSSDSGTFVNGMLTSGGALNPPVPLRITWGLLEGAVAAILLFTGGLGALQTASVVGGFPFMIIMFLMIYCLLKSIAAESREGTLLPDKKRLYDTLKELKAGK